MNEREPENWKTGVRKTLLGVRTNGKTYRHGGVVAAAAIESELVAVAEPFLGSSAEPAGTGSGSPSVESMEADVLSSNRFATQTS